MQKIYHIDKTKTNWKHDWLIARKKGIGASDIASVCNINPWQSAISVWYDKSTDEINIEGENIAMELGLELEPFLARKFTKTYKKYYGEDIILLEMPYIIADDRIDYFTCNLDRYFMEKKNIIPVELKTTAEYHKSDWEGNKMPLYYYYQVQWQIMITNAPYGFVGFLIGNRKFDIKEVPRDDEVIKELAKRGKYFWLEFVVKKIAPAPDGSESSKGILNLLYPEELPESGIELTGEEEEEIIAMVEIIDTQKEIEKVAKKEKEKAQQTIKAKIGNNEYMIAGDRKITYKTISVPEHLVGAMHYRKLHIGERK